MPRTGRPRSFDKDEAIEKAMLLLWARGFAATSLADLKAAMGIGSPTSFYAAFGSKDALLEAVLSRYLASHGQVMNALHDPAFPPREAIERALRDTVRMQTDPNHPAGCLVALSAAEDPMLDTAIARLLAKERRRTTAGIATCVARAVQTGEFRTDVDVSGLVTAIDAMMAGLSLRARDGADRGRLERAVSFLMQLWDLHARTPLGELDLGATAHDHSRRAGASRRRDHELRRRKPR